MEQAHREFYWNIHFHWVMYVLMVVSFAAFGYGVFKKVMLWKKLKPQTKDSATLSNAGSSCSRTF